MEKLRTEVGSASKFYKKGTSYAIALPFGYSNIQYPSPRQVFLTRLHNFLVAHRFLDRRHLHLLGLVFY